eukprot:5865278-Pleurochrysis_carterae.AAC.4
MAASAGAPLAEKPWTQTSMFCRPQALITSIGVGAQTFEAVTKAFLIVTVHLAAVLTAHLNVRCVGAFMLRELYVQATERPSVSARPLVRGL